MLRWRVGSIRVTEATYNLELFWDGLSKNLDPAKYLRKWDMT